MSATPNQSNFEAALGKLHAFCSSYSLFKSDEEIRNSFDSFFANDNTSLSEAEKERILKEYKALDELLSVLPELARELKAESFEGGGKEIPQADCGNRLFASLKRHPE